MKTLDALLRDWPLATEIHKLQSRLWRQTQREKMKTVLVTSALRGEGKTMTMSYLSVSCAIQGDRRILALDLDLRQSTLNSFFELDTKLGLNQVLGGEGHVKDAIISTKLPGLDVILPGETGLDPNLLLRSPRLEESVDWLRDQYDLIYMDSPALVPVADASSLIPLSDGVVMVAMAGRTQKPYLTHAYEICRGMGANMLGLVIGNMQEAVPDYYDPAHYYGYSAKKKPESV